MAKIKIGIVGYGVVGKAADETLKSNYQIVKYDKFLNLDSFDNLMECKFVFVMVPTPLIAQPMQSMIQQF